MDKNRHAKSGAAIAAATILLSLAALPARAEVPGGSYLQTCTHVRALGDRVIADCRRVDGSWNRTEMRDADSCAGGMANMNGHLTCNHARRDYGRLDRPWEGYGSSRPWNRDRYGDRFDYYGR